MKKASFRVLTLLFLILPIYLTFFANNNQVKSTQVSYLKDQLSSAQLSFFGRVASYTGSIFKIDTTANPSRTSANLATGDTISVANVGITTVTQYIVKDIGDTATIELNSGIGTTNYASSIFSYAVATRSAIHTITFTPEAAYAGEKWQFLIRATNRSGELLNDGMPDQTGFDLGQDIGSTTTGIGTRLKVADVVCPVFGAGTTTVSVGTTVIITSGVSVGFTGTYHVIECALAAGTSNAGIATSMVVGRALSAGSQLINPSAGISHTAGQANATSDTHVYAIRQLDSNDVVRDTTFGKLAVTESVRVTAIVDPTITFTIGTSNSTSAGTTRCSNPISSAASDTTATAVSFGPLTLNAANNLSQSLHCTTNSTNGYVIQAFENQPMTIIGSAITIPNTNCDGNGCTTALQRAWTTFNNSGFGYSLEVGVTTGTGSNVSIGITTSGHYRPFGVGSANAQTLLSRTDTPGGSDSIYICYRAAASTTQQAGTYENNISFIATATF